MTTTTHPGFAYDATAILGFGPASAEPLPEAAPDEIVIRYGGWSLLELIENDSCKRLMRQQDWYCKYPWSDEQLPAGIYRLRIPLPDSNGKSFAEQQTLLPLGEHVAPVVLVASAVLAHRLQTGENLLKSVIVRCKEQDAGYRVGLRWDEDRLFVNSLWDVVRFVFVWLASVRTS